MTTYKLEIAYDGSGFKGYARQSGQRTIQAEMEGALSTLLKDEVATAVAGRTDAGVHARGQVISFVHPEILDVERLRRSLDGIVGPEVSVRSVEMVADDFNARFSARWRRYRYLLDMGLTADPLTRGFVWHVGRSLDVLAMTTTARAFLGEHDFSSFCRSVEGKSNVRRVIELTLSEDSGSLAIWVQANAFCHQMVRSIVGYLYDVGRGFSDGSQVSEVIAAADRGWVATVAPPHGLTLWSVGY